MCEYLLKVDFCVPKQTCCMHIKKISLYCSIMWVDNISYKVVVKNASLNKHTINQ